MANNKLWAVCKDDNRCILMAKNYSDWYMVNGEKDYNDFFEEHKDCKSNRGCGENIVFVTDVDDDRVEKYDFTDYYNIKIFIKNDK